MSATPPDLAGRLESLGQPIDEFRVGKGYYVLSLILGVTAFVVGILSLAGLIAWAFADRAGVRPLLFKWIFIPIVLFLAGSVAIRRARSNRGLRVLVFGEGLARVLGDKVEVMRWEDINAIRRIIGGEGAVLSPVQLIVQGREGHTLVFDESLGRLRELRTLVEQHTLPHMLPPAREALDAGETIAFGALAVSREGLHHGASHALGWDAYQDAEAGGGFLTVRSAGARKPFCRLPLAHVPNAHVLLALAEHARYRYS